MIAGEVVAQQQEQPAVAGPVARDIGAHQRRFAHVNPVVARVEACEELLGHVPSARIQLHLLHRKRRIAPDDLHRLAQSLPDHGRAQDVVPRNYRGKRLQVRVEARTRVETSHGV